MGHALNPLGLESHDGAMFAPLLINYENPASSQAWTLNWIQEKKMQIR